MTKRPNRFLLSFSFFLLIPLPDRAARPTQCAHIHGIVVLPAKQNDQISTTRQCQPSQKSPQHKSKSRIRKKQIFPLLLDCLPPPRRSEEAVVLLGCRRKGDGKKVYVCAITLLSLNRSRHPSLPHTAAPSLSHPPVLMSRYKPPPPHTQPPSSPLKSTPKQAPRVPLL